MPQQFIIECMFKLLYYITLISKIFRCTSIKIVRLIYLTDYTMKYNNKQNGFPNRLHEKTKVYVKNTFS